MHIDCGRFNVLYCHFSEISGLDCIKFGADMAQSTALRNKIFFWNSAILLSFETENESTKIEVKISHFFTYVS